MDTRHAPGNRDPFRRPDQGTETAPVDLVELVELRYAVTAQRRTGLGSIVSGFALLGVLAVIAILAIATSTGWSVVRGY
jgi:hypothetical protein